MTTARTPRVSARTASRSAKQSSSVRNACTPSGIVVPSPRNGGSTGFDPVASTSRPYRTTLPSSQCTSRSARSIRTTRTPRRTSAGGRAMTSAAYRPASTSASSTRLYGACASSPMTVTPGTRAASRAPAIPAPITTTRAASAVSVVMVSSLCGGCYPTESSLFPGRNLALSVSRSRL